MEQSKKKFGFTSEEGKFIDLGLPEAEMEGGFLSTFYRTLVIIGTTITSVEDTKDIRIPLITDFLIALVTDDVIRDEIRERKKTTYEERIEEVKNANNGRITNEQMGAVNFENCMRTIGEVVSFFDQFSGLTHKLAIGTI